MDRNGEKTKKQGVPSSNYQLTVSWPRDNARKAFFLFRTFVGEPPTFFSTERDPKAARAKD